MATVTVRGTAARQVQPDFVVVSLGLTTVAKDAPAALDLVAQWSDQLADLLAGLGLRQQDWVTEGVNVAEEFEWRKDAQVSVGYRATTGVAATLRQLDQVGRLLRDAVGACHATVRSLSWQVDPDNPVRREVLGDAARDARQRAEAYTAALGLGLGKVEAISDEPLRGGPDAGGAMEAMAYGARSKMADADASMTVSGGLVSLSSEVYIRFSTVSAS